MSGVVYGILERDLDGDGYDDVVVAKRVGPGYALMAYFQRPSPEGTDWVSYCVGPLVVGEALTTWRWVEMGGRSHVLVVATEEDPEEAREAFALVDVKAACLTRLADVLRLPKPERGLVAPDSVPAGVVVASTGDAVRLVDEPEFLELEAAGGQRVRVLTSVRQRLIVAVAGGLEVLERRSPLLEERRLELAWLRPAAASVPLEMVADDSDETSFVARKDEAGELVISADSPIALVEIHHGCRAGTHAPLELRLQGGAEPYVTGTQPSAGSFVLARGRDQTDESGVQRSLLALLAWRKKLTLAVGPCGRERCIRQVRAFGFPKTLER